MFGDEPDRFFRRHPVKTIESSEIHRARVAAQRALAPQIEIDIEITHGQLTQAPINRLAIPASGEIRFRHCAPMSADLENGDDMIGVLLGFQIENQRRKTDDAQRRSAKNAALKAGGGAIMQNLSRRSRGVREIVREIVEKLLNAGGRLQSAQLAQLRRCETKTLSVYHKRSCNIQARVTTLSDALLQNLGAGDRWFASAGPSGQYNDRMAWYRVAARR